MPQVALTREVSEAIARCELTHLARLPIDVDVARAEHAAYERALIAAGCRVERIPAAPDLPDAVFIEDIAIVLDEIAIVTRPGAESRRPERTAVSAALERYRALRFIEAPGTLDGGDVLTMARRLYVGVSSRTNVEGIAQLRRILGPHGYTVCEVPVTGCLHLKSAVTALGVDMVLANPAWIPPAAFSQCDRIAVDPAEPAAANALRVNDRIIFPAAFPRTAGRLAARGFEVVPVAVAELAKAEGAVTCCSLVFDTK